MKIRNVLNTVKWRIVLRVEYTVEMSDTDFESEILEEFLSQCKLSLDLNLKLITFFFYI